MDLKKWIDNEIVNVKHRLEFKSYNSPKDEIEDLELYNLLIKMKDEVNQSFMSKIDPNVLIQVGGSIFMLFLILRFEKVDTITSKGFSIFQKSIRG